MANNQLLNNGLIAKFKINNDPCGGFILVTLVKQ